MKSKTIILSSLDSHNPRAGRGILTLTNEDDVTSCKLRLYNIMNLPVQSKLGIYINNKVIGEKLVSRNGYYDCKISEPIELEQDFYTAVVDTENKNKVVIAGGTYAGFYFEDTDFSENSSEIEANEEKINNCSSDKIDDCDKCARCKYKEYFYSEQSESKNLQSEDKQNTVSTDANASSADASLNSVQQTSSQEEQDLNSHKSDIPSIINSILPQFNYIFENYPVNEELNNLMEDSKFVTINEAGEEYSIGAIFSEGKMKYICYATKTRYNTPAPEELGKYHQWLPLDPEDPLSDGYQIVFQDASDLKIIEI